MGMLHLYLLVTFSTFLSVRSCGITGNKSCVCRTGSCATFGGKWETLGGNHPSKKVIFVLKSPPINLKEFKLILAAGRIRFQKGKICQHNLTAGCLRSKAENACPYRPIIETDYVTTTGTTTTETVTLTGSTLSTANMSTTSSTTENDGTTTETVTLTRPTLSTPNTNTTSSTTENDGITTTGTTTTETVTLTRSTLSTPTVNTTSSTTENDGITTTGTTTTETVTLTRPTLSTPNVNTTSSITVRNFTSNWSVETGSNVRGKAYITLQWTIDRTKCSSVDHPSTLMVKRIKNPCNETVHEGPREYTTYENSRTIRGLKADSYYNVTHTVFCSNDTIGCDTHTVHTAESVPTAAPTDITVKEKNFPRRSYLIFKWKEPPCDGKNGKITNYDFIFTKNHNTIHNVTPKKIAILPFIGENKNYTFIVRANTARGFGTYSSPDKVEELPPLR